MRLLPLLLCLPLSLTACAGRPAPSAAPARSLSLAAPAFPEEYAIAFHLEAFQGSRQTSRTRVAAVQTPEGLCYADSTGARCLFLRQGADTYLHYIWDDAGALVRNGEEAISGAALAGFRDTVLHLGLLVQDTSGLEETGSTRVAGRPCRVLEGEGPAGSQFTCRRRYCVDEETGLALSYSLRYRGQGGRTFTYRLVCQRFSTQEVSLSLPEDLLRDGETKIGTPQAKSP